MGSTYSIRFYQLIFSIDVVEHHHQALEWNVLFDFGWIAALLMTPPPASVFF